MLPDTIIVIEECHMTKEEIIKIYKIIRKTLLVNGIFYRFSLKKNAALLDHNKFLEDPWPGDQAAGNNFINNVIKIRDFYVNADAIRFIDCNDSDFDYAAMYINSFAWIRDLQAVGGFETKKTIRYAIERFITQYRESLAFWKKSFFDVLIVSERIMNWLIMRRPCSAGVMLSGKKAFLPLIPKPPG